MTRTKKWLVILAATVMAGTASAISVDGQWDDWFSYGGTSNSNWSQSSASGSLLNSAIRYQDDSDDDAYGGQNYDIEQIFYLYEDLDPNAYTGGMLYIGMVTGYEPTNGTYRSGDMFIDLGYAGGAHSYDLAIGTGTENGGSRLGDTWTNSGWTTSGVTISGHSGSNPYRVRTDLSGDTPYTGASIDWDYENGPGDKHNFLEIGLFLNGTMEELIALNGIGLHWTMACGNDNINVYDSNPLSTIPPPPPPPLDPVPEPATLVLLGMGALGLVLKHHRTEC
jgi:hypothetical protein